MDRSRRTAQRADATDIPEGERSRSRVSRSHREILTGDRGASARRASDLRAAAPGAIELVYDNYNALGIGFAATEKASDVIFSIALYPRWINLFFAKTRSAFRIRKSSSRVRAKPGGTSCSKAGRPLPSPASPPVTARPRRRGKASRCFAALTHHHQVGLRRAAAATPSRTGKTQEDKPEARRPRAVSRSSVRRSMNSSRFRYSRRA